MEEFFGISIFLNANPSLSLAMYVCLELSKSFFGSFQFEIGFLLEEKCLCIFIGNTSAFRVEDSIDVRDVM